MSSKLIGCISVLLKEVMWWLVGRLDRVRGRFVMLCMSGRRTSEGDGVVSKLSGAGKLRIPGEVGLARAATRPLARDDHAVVEDLATPDTPRLAAVESTSKALDPDRAVDAERLGEFELGRRLGEPQVRIESAARDVDVHLDLVVESGERQRHRRFTSFQRVGR